MLVNVELLGINDKSINDSQANQDFTYGRTLPWLQDTAEANVWTLLNARYRDVLILDSSNRVAGVFNLSSHDLGILTNRAQLRSMLLEVANAGDSDGDSLPDQWEYRYLHGLQGNRDDDPDHDGYTNFQELAFGTDPMDPEDYPRFDFRFNVSKQFILSFNRWAGTGIDFLADGSTNLLQWTNSTQVVRSARETMFDGTGRAKATYTLAKPYTSQSTGFIRLNLEPVQ